MGSLTNYSENELLDHVFNAAYTAPATVYLGLATADPTDAATGASTNEVANSGGYSRTAITFGAASSRRVTQSAEVDFGTSSGSWGTVTHWFIADSATHGAGNVLAYGAFDTGKAVTSGIPVTVAASEVYVELGAGVSDYCGNALLDLMFRNQAFSAPSTYVGLTTATVASSNTGSTITEVSGGSYARVQVNANGGSSPTWDVASSGLVDNGAAISFPDPTGTWGAVTSVVICDAATNGNLLFFDNDMADTASITTGDTVQFPIGDLDATLS